MLDPDVRPDTIDRTICVPGYTASVRPSATYTTGVKLKRIRESCADASNASSYELDHVIPLTVDGQPRNIKNLVLQPWDGEDGAKKKDRLERRLQQLVCSKLLGLRDAQAAIWTDWQAAYRCGVTPSPRPLSPQSNEAKKGSRRSPSLKAVKT